VYFSKRRRLHAQVAIRIPRAQASCTWGRDRQTDALGRHHGDRRISEVNDERLLSVSDSVREAEEWILRAAHLMHGLDRHERPCACTNEPAPWKRWP
jgi:hypothetical protein